MGNGSLVAYSGLTTKIRAMKNQLLSPKQYDEITELKTVPELITYLQNFPSYVNVFSTIDSTNIHRGEIESRLTFSTYSDFSKIFHFAVGSQKKFLEFYFMKYEVALLKACMRNIMDSRTDANPVLTDSHFKRHTKLNIDKLTNCKNINEFIDSLSKTTYSKPLKKVQELDSPTLFDYEMSLDLFFFSYIWNNQEDFVEKHDRNLFKKSFGAQIDLLNTLWIYRCKNFYNLTNAQIYSYLIPVYYNLESLELKSFVEANSNEELFELIDNSYYGRNFDFDFTQSIEPQFASAVTSICLNNFKNSPYSLSAINSYFHLKNLEVSRVITAMECIRYGYEPEVISQFIYQKGGIL